MGIDTIIDWPCTPKEALSTAGIIERLKGRDQANAVLKLYREQGDHRPPQDIGFEVSRRAADGSLQTETRVVADVLDWASQLDNLAPHCQGCPANRSGQPFGCVHTINFPLSEAGEIWLLGQLPSPGSPLLHLLQRGIEEYGYDGETVRKLRQEQSGVYFEASDSLGRPYPDESLIITTDMLFEMMFMVGPIQPSHAAMLMLFLNVIPRDDLGPDDIFWLMNGAAAADMQASDDRLQLRIERAPDDPPTVKDLKAFLHAVYLAYHQQVALLVDV